VSVIVAARNEEGNIPRIFDRLPQMGSGTELIVVEGGSQDGTYQAVQNEIAAALVTPPGYSAKPARARATPCGWASRKPPATS